MKPLVLCWHSVEADNLKPKSRNTNNPSESLFREQIKFIVDRYTPVSISEFIDLIENRQSGGKYNKPPVLLTFDDGFRNVLIRALPILSEFRVPAVLFVISTCLIDPDFVPWFVEIRHLLRRTRRRIVHYNGSVFDLNQHEDHRAFRSMFAVGYKESRSESRRQILLDDVARLLQVHRPIAFTLDEDLSLVSKEDLKTLNSRSLLTVASHGMTHRNLDSLSREEQVYELEQSHLSLKGNCAYYYPAVAYPDGSLNAESVAIARRIYRAGFALLQRSSYRDLYAYPRICIGNDAIEELSWSICSTRIRYILPIKRLMHSISN